MTGGTAGPASVLPTGFEEDDALRSAFIRELTIEQIGADAERNDRPRPRTGGGVPRTLVRYWHDPDDLPADVAECMESWEGLRAEGFALLTFDDRSAAAWIGRRYGPRATAAFARCRHPAMRSDYLRLCFLLAEGGLYVDADDVLVGEGWRPLVEDDLLKLQPLCYDLDARGMVPAEDIWRVDMPVPGRIFYVNNDPLVAPAGHPLLHRALERATDRLLGADPRPEIQSTTGPGNLSAALAAHANSLRAEGRPADFVLLRAAQDWAATRWDLSYRADWRNWRTMDAD